MSVMQALKAHVRNGYFVSDEPTDLPEGTEGKILVDDVFAGMDPAERAELEESIEGGERDFEQGDHMEARAFLAQLRAKNS
jgi:NADPH-dependent curcumin reductase CurA